MELRNNPVELKGEVKVSGQDFELFISADEIQRRINEIAEEISTELSESNPLFVAVLNGAFFFAADLLKQIDFPCEISFVKMASYDGMKSTGSVRTLIGAGENIKDRVVVVVEDIIDTGHTMVELKKQLSEKGPAGIRVATLILKPGALVHDITPDYVGFQAPDVFLVGYGLDYNRQGRNLKDIYKLKSN